jgi:hypothetical protein
MLKLVGSKLLAIGGAVIAALLLVIKYLAAGKKRAKRKAKVAEAALDRQSDIHKIDTELDKELQSREAEIKAEAKKDEKTDSGYNPNDWS